MKPYTKIYLEYFDYDESDFISCEVCGQKAVDIHHISAKGMGGSKKKDVIENLMALCRKCHINLGDKKQWVELLVSVHNRKMNRVDKKNLTKNIK